MAVSRVAAEEHLQKFPPTKEHLIKMAQYIGFVLSQVDAAECLIFCQRGTMHRKNFNLDLLIDWLCKNIPRMRSYIPVSNRFPL